MEFNIRYAHAKRFFAGMSDDYDAVVKQITEGSSSMPAFEDILTEVEIEAIAKYINEVIAPMGK